MSEDEKKYVTPELVLSDEVVDEEKEHYERLYDKLSPMMESSLNISGIQLERRESGEILADVFVRSSLPKTVSIEEYPIVLLDQNNDVVARKVENFTGLGELGSKTAKLWSIEFTEEQIEQYDFEKLENWSIAFEENLQHRLDLSDLDESKISKETKDFLKQVLDRQELQKDELNLTGLSVKPSADGGLNATLLISNGTRENLKIKQLPLKLYDAADELVAQGTFRMQGLTVLANTSKPISMVFPATSLLKRELDLSSWSIRHQE